MDSQRRLFRIVEQDETEWQLIAIVQELNNPMCCDICNRAIEVNTVGVIGEKYESLFVNHLSCYLTEGGDST